MQSIRVLLLLLCVAIGSAAGAAQRNIVVFISDDHGRDAGCYGNPVIRTPNLDSLAEDGVVFDRAYCTATSCSPSRSVLLSGLHTHANGMYGLAHDTHHFTTFESVRWLPTLLSEAGYRTAYSGKMHINRSVDWFDKSFKAPNRNPVALANVCREFIEEDSDRPFFLWLGTYDPHRGYEDDLTNPLEPNLFGNEWDFPEIHREVYSPDEVIVPSFLPDTPACRAELAEYYQSVSRVDQGVGAMIKLLKESGHWDDTLLVYLSDHGIAMAGAKTTLYEPGMRSPLIVRDPYSPRRGWRTDDLVSWTDIMPTLLDFAGAQYGAGAEYGSVEEPETDDHPEPGRSAPLGHSLLPLLRGNEAAAEAARRDAVFGSLSFHEVTMYYPMRAIVEEKYKLIWNLASPLEFPFAMDLVRSRTWQDQLAQGPDTPYGARTVEAYLHRPEFELYDLDSDPEESTNLADRPEHAETLARLKERLRVFQEQSEDAWLLKWDRE